MDSKEKISVESVKKLFKDDDSDQNVEGLYKCEVARENDYKLKELWESASKANEPFPKFDDGYDNDYYHDDDDADAVEKMSELPKMEELMDREERRTELKKYYDQFLEDHKKAFPQIYKEVKKPKQSPAKPRSAPKPAPKTTTFDDSDSDVSISSDSDSDVAIDDDSSDLDDSSDREEIISSQSSDDEEVKKPSKPSKTEKPKQKTSITYNELLNATISGTRLNGLLKDFKTFLKQKYIIFIHYRNGDQNSIGYLKHTNKCDELEVNCYDIISDAHVHLTPDEVLDEQIPRSLFDKIHYDLSSQADDIRRGIKLLKNNIEFKSKSSRDDTNELEKLYNMVMDGQLHNISGYKFQLQEEIKKLQEEVGDELDDVSADDVSNQLRERIAKMRVWLQNVEDMLRKQPDPKAIVDHPVVIPKGEMSAFEKLLKQPKKPSQKPASVVVDQQSQEKNYKESLKGLFGDDDDSESSD